MKRICTLMTTALLLAAGTIVQRSHMVPAAAAAQQSLAKRVCHLVTKTAHGKKTRVKVCRSIKGKPTPQPTPEPHHFTILWGSAVDAQGNVYVSDVAAGQVDKLSPSGDVLARWPVPADPNVAGSPEPRGPAVDAQGNVYVPDSVSYRIIKFDPSGKVVASWHLPHDGVTEGSSGVGGLAIDARGNVWATDVAPWEPLDATHSQVLEYSPSGALLASFGRECPHPPGQRECAVQDQTPPATIPPGQLNHPFGIALDPQGNIYVNDHRDGRAVKFAPSGQQLMTFGPILPDAFPKMDYPEAIGVDRAGDLFVHGRNPESVVKLAPTGTPLAKWDVPAGWAFVGDPGTDAQGNVYVTISAFSWDEASQFHAQVIKLSPTLQKLADWE